MPMKAISPTLTAIIVHSRHHGFNHHRWFLSLPHRPQQHLTGSIPKPLSLKLTFIPKAADSTSQPNSSSAAATKTIALMMASRSLSFLLVLLDWVLEFHFSHECLPFEVSSFS
ncbi:hypothetical protein CRYUN_Cryun20dG0048100 [Craigia yunnanensis]